MSRIDSFTNLSPLKTTLSRKVISFSDISVVNFILVGKSKDRLHGLLMWLLWLRHIIRAFKLSFCSYKHVFSVVWRFHAHCCCNSCSGYNRTGGFDSIRESLQLLFENRQCCKLLEGKVEMFSQFRSRWKYGVATFLSSNFCGLGWNLHCSYCWFSVSRHSK